MTDIIRADEAPLGETFYPAEGPQVPLVVLGPSSFSPGLINLQHGGTGAVQGVDPGFLLTAAQPAAVGGLGRPQGFGLRASAQLTQPLPSAALAVEHAQNLPAEIHDNVEEPGNDRVQMDDREPPAIKPPRKVRAQGAQGTLKRVSTSIKGGFDLVLPAQHTLILGDNGSRKSALVNAVELAAQGGCSDLVGREWSTGIGFLSSLIDPAHQDALVSRVECVRPDGSTVILEYRAKVSGTTKSGLSQGSHTKDGVAIDKANPSPVALPVRAVLTELRASPERAQAFLLSVACAVDEAAFLKVVPPAQSARVKAIWTSLKKAESVVEKILAVQAECQKLEREAAKKAKDFETAAETSTRTLDVRPTPEELAQVEQELRVLQGRRAALAGEWATHAATQRAQQQAQQQARTVSQQSMEQIQAALAQAHAARIQELRAEQQRLEATAATSDVQVAEWRSQLAQIVVPAGIPQDRVERLQALHLLCTHQVQQATGKCPTCAGALPTPTALEVVQGVEGLLAQNAAKLQAEGLIQQLEAAISRAQTQRQELEAHWARLQAQIDTPMPTPAAPPLAVQIPQVSLGLAPMPTQTLEDVDLELIGAQSVLDRVRGLDRAWAGYDALKTQQAAAATEARDLEYLNKILGDFVQTQVNEASRAFVGRVQGFLSKPDRFWLNTGTGRFGLQRSVGICPTCSRPGLRVEAKDQVEPHYWEGQACAGGTAGAIHPRQDAALSGAEWARVVMALAAATVGPEVEFGVLIPEDRDWAEGGKTLKEALKGLSVYTGPIIFPAATVPARGVPKGWGVVVFAKDGTVLLNAVDPSGADIDAAMKKATA